jgi:hypothetical protein
MRRCGVSFVLLGSKVYRKKVNRTIKIVLLLPRNKSTCMTEQNRAIAHEIMILFSAG